MLKGKNTACIWLEAFTCHSKRTDDTDGKARLGMGLCSSELFAYGCELI